VRQSIGSLFAALGVVILLITSTAGPPRRTPWLILWDAIGGLDGRLGNIVMTKYRTKRAQQTNSRICNTSAGGGGIPAASTRSP